jgi:excinuclease ABC subunit C
MRGGRVVERVELATDPGALAVGDVEVLQAAVAQFYELRVPPSEINLPVEIEDSEAVEEWLSARAGRRVKILVHNVATSGRWWNWRRATRSWPIAPASTRSRPPISRRWRRSGRSWP